MNRKSMMRLLTLFLSGAIAIQSFAQGSDTNILEPKQHYGDEAKLAVQILDTYHYQKLKMGDSLSAVILHDFISSLDKNKSYFLKSDIESFQKYETSIDDMVQNGDVGAAYEIFNVFKQRFDERMDHVYDNLLDMEYDYTLDEYYDTDREDMPYVTTKAELDEIWRKAIKSQFLNLRLNGKADSSIVSTIKKRYDRFKKSIYQYNGEDIFELYMNSIAESYDPHTNYFSPKTSDRFQQNMSLSLEGIGARLSSENDYIKIVEVLPGGPAMKSNQLQPNDLIIGVAQGDEDMVDLIGWRVDDAVTLIKGPKGTTVRLEILPAESGVNGKSKIVTLVREKIKLEDLQAKAEVVPITRDGNKFNIGLITLPSFYMDFEAYQKGDPNYTSTTRDVKRLIKELEGKGIDGLMIDLRNNGGGSLAEAIDLTGLFIEDGPVVQVKTAANKIEVGEDEDPELAYDGPLAVLINRFSASASEIFAGAIQDYSRGVVLGETSFGKGTVQSVIDLGRYLNLPEGEKVGQLKLTLQKFYRVTGSSTQHLGVSPDVFFPSAFSAEEFGESSRPSALPWDQIKGTRYKAVENVSVELLSALNSDYQKRLKTDKDLTLLVLETEELKKSIENTRISLNEETRKLEREEADNRKNNASMGGMALDKEGIIKVDNIDVDDKYLREGLVILSDIINSIG